MICIFDKMTAQDKFDSCGERILNPSSAYVLEEFNGNYSYEMTVPILPGDDSWNYVIPHNIIKSTKGQLFPIYKVEYDWTGSFPVVKAWARHIWYYLADKMTFDCRNDMYSCYWAIDNMMKHVAWGRGDNLTDYNFSYNSNINTLKYAEYDEVTAANAILGGAESIVNLYGGELYRDNFYFSVNSVRELAEENAFTLLHNFNCSGVKHTIDYSNTITEVRASDNVGNAIAISRVPDRAFPHQVMLAKKLSYNKETNHTSEEFYADASDLWTDNAYADITYEINFVDMKDTTRAEGWGDLEKMVVGNTGYITDAISTSKQRIISTKYNELTGRMENVKLGSFKPSELHSTRWDKILSGDNAAYRRLDLLEQKSSVFTLVED